MTTMTGGCHCGALRYSIDIGPIMAVSHCHCTDCRRASGAPFITWITTGPAGFAYTQGAPAIYRSSENVRRTFCGKCGTSLGFAMDGHGDELDVAAATLDDPALLNPDDHIWAASMLPWFTFADGLPQLPGSHWEHGYPDRS